MPGPREFALPRSREPAPSRFRGSARRGACRRAFPLVLACWTAACAGTRTWTELQPPWTEARIAPEKQLRVRAHETPTVVLLEDAHVTTHDGRTFLAGRNAEPPHERGELAFDAIASIEVERYDTLGTVTLILVIALVVGGIVFAQYTPSGGAFFSF